MSEKLFEAGLLTVDLRRAFNGADTGAEAPVPPIDDQPEETKLSSSNLEEWSKYLEDKLATNKKAKKPKLESEILKKFFEEFFEKFWNAPLAQKLIELGTPLQHAIIRIGFTDKNPILAFMLTDFAIARLTDGTLDKDRFKAIYNAVAKNIVANSEFRKQNSYNIIYCADLYRKSADEMEKYLKLQGKILDVPARIYDAEVQERNRRTFLHIASIKELDIVKRVKEIQKSDKVVATVAGATLNGYELAEKIANAISGKEYAEATVVDNDTQDDIIKKLGGDRAKIFAALMSISFSTGNKDAVKALSSFGNISAADLAVATTWLASNEVIPKGRLNASDAQALVKKLIAATVTE